MDKLTMALVLIELAKNKEKRLTEYQEEYAEAVKKDNDPEHSVYTYENRWAVEEKYRPIPTKTEINDYIKMARRLLARAYLK